MAHPEVLRVHMQLVAVEFAQLSKALLDIVQVLDSFPEGGEHFLAMGADHGVAKDGGGAGEVPEGSEEPLGPGVDDQMVWVGKGLKDHPVPPPALGRDTSHHTRLLQAPSNLALNPSRDGAATSSPAKCFSHHLLWHKCHRAVIS
uniref:Uncharacterized protein n=1 Tax=Calidris pygmaea TaxID=425635 RepID=A0A8C3JV61_9CHAR